MRAGTVLVGGGPLGAWLALEATRAADPLRDPVVLFEAGDLRAGAGPLQAFDPSGGLLPLGLSPELAPLLRDGAHALTQFEPQTGRSLGFCRPGLLELGAEPPEGGAPSARWTRDLGLEPGARLRLWEQAAVVDPEASHAEVLALARTRGATARPGTRVEGLLVEAGRVVGVATDRGPCQAERVVLCSHAAAMELLTPEQRGGLRELTPEPWCEHALPSALVRVEAGGQAELPPGGIAELGTDPAALDAFFSTGDELEAPHACLLEAGTGDLIAASPLAGSLVLVGSSDPTPLLARHGLAALHGDLGPARVRRGQAWRAVDGRPLVGPVPGVGGVFLALGCGRAEALLAPGLAAGLVAELEGRPVAAYDRARLAPGRS